MSGYDIARKIRTGSSPIAKVPLLAFSASVERDAKRCVEAGFDGYLPKPVPREKMLDMIETLLSGHKDVVDHHKTKPIVTQHTIMENAKRSVHILLAEDNPVNQKLAKTMLSKAGYQVDVVNNGKEALHQYTTQPSRYDLIFMDLQMPEMDGLKATQAIRTHEKKAVARALSPKAQGDNPSGFDSIRAHVPIVAMTAHALSGDREKCLKAGMDDYISKPIRREKVFEIAEKWVFSKKHPLK
jgi:CheY-like chemotaxis protein